MRRALPVVVTVLVAVSLWVTGGSAGPEKIAFPVGGEKFVLYNAVDRYDIKQYRELYASSQDAVDAVKAGKPLPQGSPGPAPTCPRG